jgi:hypothetical protein
MELLAEYAGHPRHSPGKWDSQRWRGRLDG